MTEPWLRDNGFSSNDEVDSPWRKNYHHTEKIRFSYVRLFHSESGIFVDCTEGGMWVVGFFLKKKENAFILFNQSPPPTTIQISCLTTGLFNEKIGPTSSLKVCLADHKVNVPMLRESCKRVMKNHEKEIHGTEHAERDPTDEMYFENIKSLLDILKS